jgi:hypothetical protein
MGRMAHLPAARTQPGHTGDNLRLTQTSLGYAEVVTAQFRGVRRLSWGPAG